VPRPSRNVDAALLASGRALYPAAGVRGLSVRKVVERAGVNLGMFHYHFRSKEAFVRALLQQLYDGMFAELELAAHADARPVESLRAALLVMARFVRDHRRLLRRLLADAMNDEPVALEFAHANLPRHVGVVLELVAAGQRDGSLRPLAPPQALAFVAGSIGAPILLGSMIAERNGAARALRGAFETRVVSDDALAERVELAIAGLCAPVAARKPARGPRSARR
jgi:AcrR family transcriptional regulator